MNFNQHYRNKLINQLQHIITGDQKHADNVKKEEDYFISQIKPKNLDGNDSENIIYQSRKEFENLCVILINQGVDRPEKMTLLRFFSTLKYFETKNKNSPKQKAR